MRTLLCIGSVAAALFAATAARADDPAAPAATTAPATPAASAPATPRQHCYKEYRVGSNFPVTHCESEETAADRQRIDAIQGEIRRSTSQVTAPGGR